MRKGAFGAGAVGSFATVAGAVLTLASFGMGLPVLIGGIGLNISSAVTENKARKKGERYKEEKVEIAQEAINKDQEYTTKLEYDIYKLRENETFIDNLSNPNFFHQLNVEYNPDLIFSLVNRSYADTNENSKEKELSLYDIEELKDEKAQVNICNKCKSTSTN